MSSGPPDTDSVSLPDGVTDAAVETRGTDPASAAAPPSRRTALIRSGLIVGVLIVVFGFILPQYIDYADVADAFRDLTVQQILVMTGLAIVAWSISGLVFCALIEGLSAVRGTMSWLILATVVSWLLITQRLRVHAARGNSPSPSPLTEDIECERFPDQCPCTTELGKGVA